MIAKFIAWALIIVMCCWIIGSVISIVKTVIARRKALSEKDKNNAGEEVKKDGK